MTSFANCTILAQQTTTSNPVSSEIAYRTVGMWRSQPISADFMCKICRIQMRICRTIKITSY